MPLDVTGVLQQVQPTTLGSVLNRTGAIVEAQNKQRAAQQQQQRVQMINQTLQQFGGDAEQAIKFLQPRDYDAAMALQDDLTKRKTDIAKMIGVELENEGKRDAHSKALADAKRQALADKNIEAWQALNADNPDAIKAGLFVMGPKDFASQQTSAANASTSAFNAETQRIQEERLGKPPAPQPFTLGPGQTRFGPDGKPIVAVAPRPAAESGGGEAVAPGMVKSIMANPNLFNALTPTLKQKLIVPLTEAGFDFAQNVAGDGKPSNGVEKKALSFFNRARQASEDLEKIEDGIAKSGLVAQTWREWAPNFLQSSEGQAYTQAQRAFTEARLRKDSGAAIPEQEFTNDRKTYFVQAGDSPSTVEQKRRARAALLASLGFESGRALREFYDDEALTLIEDYKAKAKGQAAKPPAETRQSLDSFSVGGFTVRVKK
jgi:hypothetical protein